MRLLLLACVLGTALHAQADPVYPEWPVAPDELKFRVEARTGYDTNVRLTDNRRDTSPYQQGEAAFTYALTLPFGRLFCSARGVARLQWLHPDTSTWSVETRVGWADGEPWQDWFIGADVGVRIDRNWVYEIYGPRTRHEEMLRTVLDLRTWGEVWTTGVRPRTVWWFGLHDFTEGLDDASFNPADLRFRDGQPPLPYASPDFFRFGGLLWAAAAPSKQISIGPYFWFDASRFLEQRNVVPQDQDPDSRLALQRFQFGPRFEFSFEHVGLDADMHIRIGETQGDGEDEPLDYLQLGWGAGIWVDFGLVAGRVQLNSWIRYYELLYDATVIVPGGEYRQLEDLVEAGSHVLVEFRGRPLPWLEVGVRYEWEEWASSLPDYGYRKHDIALLASIEF